MLWKYLGLQKMLDGLFDDGWCSLGLPEAGESEAAMLAEMARA